MKKNLFFILCAVFLFTAQSWGQQKWDLTPTMTATLDSLGVLTISTIQKFYRSDIIFKKMK